MKFFRSSHKLTLSLAALLVAFAIVPIVSVRSQNGQTQPPTLAAAGAGEDELGDDPTPHVEATAQPTPTATPTATPAPTPTPGPPKPPPPGPPDPPDPPLVYPGHSMLYWRVLDPKDVNDGTKPSMSDPIGGKVAIQVIIKIGRKGRLDPALNLYNTSDPNCPKPTGTLTFRLREEEDETNHIKHKDSENHADITTVFNDSQWEVWTSKEVYDGDPPPPVRVNIIGLDPGSPFSANSSDDTNYFYTRTLMWDTTRGMGDATGKLLGHNGKHTISLVKVNDQETNTVNFQKKFPDQEEWQNAGFNVQKTTHEVGNLVITNAASKDGNLDYVRFDPQSKDDNLKSPQIKLGFEDKSFTEGDFYRYLVTFVDTDTSTALQASDTLSQVPDSPITIDLPLTEPGCYGFQVTVDKLREYKVGDKVETRAIDSQTLRSQYLFFNGTGLEVVGEEDEENPPVSFTYRISRQQDSPDDLKPLSKLQIESLDGALKKGGTTSGPKEVSAEDAEKYSVTAPVIEDPEAGTGHVVATGIDDEAARYRDHKPHRLMPFNAVWAYYRVVSLEGYQSHIQISAKKPVLNLEIATGAPGRVLNVRFDNEKSTDSIASGYPKDVWQWLEKFPRAKATSGRPYSPILANVFGKGDHGSDDFEHDYSGTSAAQIGRQDTNFGPASRASWIVGIRPDRIGPMGGFVNRNYSFDSDYPPYLKGISFFNVATSFSFANGNSNDVAARIGGLSRLSIGYQKRLENVSDSLYIDPAGRPGFRPTDNVAQQWYDFLYSAPGGMGTVRSITGTGKTRRVAWSDSNSALNETRAKYKLWFTTKSSSGLTGVNPSHDSAGPDGTSTYYGWDMWTLSRPTIPILDY